MSLSAATKKFIDDEVNILLDIYQDYFRKKSDLDYEIDVYPYVTETNDCKNYVGATLVLNLTNRYPTYAPKIRLIPLKNLTKETKPFCDELISKAVELRGDCMLYQIVEHLKEILQKQNEEEKEYEGLTTMQKLARKMNKDKPKPEKKELERDELVEKYKDLTALELRRAMQLELQQLQDDDERPTQYQIDMRSIELGVLKQPNEYVPVYVLQPDSEGRDLKNFNFEINLKRQRITTTFNKVSPHHTKTYPHPDTIYRLESKFVDIKQCYPIYNELTNRYSLVLELLYPPRILRKNFVEEDENDEVPPLYSGEVYDSELIKVVKIAPPKPGKDGDGSNQARGGKNKQPVTRSTQETVNKVNDSRPSSANSTDKPQARGGKSKQPVTRAVQENINKVNGSETSSTDKPQARGGKSKQPVTRQAQETINIANDAKDTKPQARGGKTNGGISRDAQSQINQQDQPSEQKQQQKKNNKKPVQLDLNNLPTKPVENAWSKAASTTNSANSTPKNKPTQGKKDTSPPPAAAVQTPPQQPKKVAPIIPIPSTMFKLPTQYTPTASHNFEWSQTTDFTDMKRIGRCLVHVVHLRTTWEELRPILVSMAEWNFARADVRKNFIYNKNADAYPKFPSHEKLNFSVRWKLECLLSNGLFDPVNLDNDFYSFLKEQTPIRACNAFEFIQRLGERQYKPLEILKYALDKHGDRKAITVPSHCVLIRTIHITPTRIVFAGPELDTKNRVLRHHEKKIVRFLRVCFRDENLGELRQHDCSLGDLLGRITNHIYYGINVCGNHYDFLAASSSQLKENSAWFFHAEKNGSKRISAETIRSWMGDFSKCRNAAKCHARMGQCFSSTSHSIAIKPEEIEMIPDVERNGFTFTDGVGTISRELMQLVHDKVNYNNTQKLEFSAVQIRVNGCKGVLSMDPTLTGRRICIRPSMQKFTTDHYQLEIVTPARVNACHLNRQAITLLSTLGVPDESFQALHDKMLNELNGMVLDDKSALQVLSKTNMHMNDCLRIMINSGIHVQSDPFLYNMLWVTRVKMLKDLRTKTRILVENGAVLMGVSDESRRLRNNQVYIKTSKHGVISGQVVIVKNPCTHPGDVRVVNAVTLDRLQCCMDDDGNELENTFLEEIKDVIVFTQYGARPVPNEASGSDLDGDEYHVFWDPSIKPATVEPASYIALEELHEPINFDTLTRFFVNFLLNDQLGRIANAWLCHADASDQGANDDACLFLAQQHSNAVDYAKSGRPAYFPKRLKTKSVPDFTENKHKDSYLSDKIIGKLFRQITENKDPDPITEFDVIHEFDLEGVENYLQEAKELRDDYNFSLTSMMKIFGVKNEFEFVSGNVTTFGKDLSSHKEYDVRERIINAYSALRKEFLQKFEMGLDGALEEEREKKACAWYKVVYKGEYSKYEKKLYSFAWLRYGELTNIKKRSRNL